MTPFTIRTRGDNGHGCYAGVEITVLVAGLPVAVVPLFWQAFAFQAEAREHDAACDAITYWASEPERAWSDYDYATRKFIIDCKRSLDHCEYERHQRLYVQIDRAEWLCNLWGEVRYGLAVSGHGF
jgi:hypothetical protein